MVKVMKTLNKDTFLEKFSAIAEPDVAKNQLIADFIKKFEFVPMLTGQEIFEVSEETLDTLTQFLIKTYDGTTLADDPPGEWELSFLDLSAVINVKTDIDKIRDERKPTARDLF